MSKFQAGESVQAFGNAFAAQSSHQGVHREGVPVVTILREMPNWRDDGRTEPEYELSDGTIATESHLRAAE